MTQKQVKNNLTVFLCAFLLAPCPAAALVGLEEAFDFDPPIPSGP